MPRFYIGLLLLIATISLFNCNANAGEEYTLYIDPTFTEYEQSQILKAVSMWEDAVPVHFEIIYKYYDCGNGSHQICMTPTTADNLKQYGTDSNPVVWGYTHRHYSSDNSNVQIAEEALNINPLYYRDTCTHEIGHALSLKHTAFGTAMSPSISKGSHVITCTDVKQYNDIRGISNSGCQ
jgi:hypothetical protein